MQTSHNGTNNMNLVGDLTGQIRKSNHQVIAETSQNRFGLSNSVTPGLGQSQTMNNIQNNNGIQGNSHKSLNIKNAKHIDKRLNNQLIGSDTQTINININPGAGIGEGSLGIKKSSKAQNKIRDQSEAFQGPPLNGGRGGSNNFRTPVGFPPDRITAQTQNNTHINTHELNLASGALSGSQINNEFGVSTIAQSSYMKKANSKMNGNYNNQQMAMGSPQLLNQRDSHNGMIKGSQSLKNLGQQSITNSTQNLKNNFNMISQHQQQQQQLQPHIFGQKQPNKLLNSQSENKLLRQSRDQGLSTPAIGSSSTYRNKQNMFDQQSLIQNERQGLIKTPQIASGLHGNGSIPNLNININSSTKLQNNININIINNNIQLNAKNNRIVNNNSRGNELLGMSGQNMIQQYQIGRQQIQQQSLESSNRNRKSKIGLVIDHEESDVDLVDYQNQLPDFKGNKQSSSKIAGRSPIIGGSSADKSQRRNIKSGTKQSPQTNSQIWHQTGNQFSNEMNSMGQQMQPRSFINNLSNSQQAAQLMNQQLSQQSNYNIKKYNPNQPPVEIIQDQQLFTQNSQSSNLLQNYNSAGSKNSYIKPSGGVTYKTNQAHLFNPSKKSFKNNSLSQNNNASNSNTTTTTNTVANPNMNYQMNQMQMQQYHQQQQQPSSFHQQTGNNIFNQTNQQFNQLYNTQQMGNKPLRPLQQIQGSPSMSSSKRDIHSKIIKTATQNQQAQDSLTQNLQDYGVQDPILKYAFKTRGGYIPNKPSKTNQDTYFVIKNFASIRNNWFFGVCDGHGINGHKASDHVKKFLPQNIEFIDFMAQKNKLSPLQLTNQRTPAQKSGKANGLMGSRNALQSRGQSPNTQKLQSEDENQSEDQNSNDNQQSYLVSSDKNKRTAVLTEGFLKTSFDIRRRSFDCNYSGSTVVTVMVTGNKLICANVGDSRAILGSLKSKTIQLKPNETLAQANSHEQNKVWVATPLSRDHKPDMKDEKERIIQCNGRVDTFREPNGDPIGPARVWLKNENVPGLAMSRSIGDFVAASVGCSPEPEFFEMDLTEDDKFLVIASDGVWEFIQNEEVVQMLVPFWLQNNPEGACDKLVKESVAHWKKEDEVIDDITCVVVFLNVKNGLNIGNQPNNPLNQ
eukprot:403355459